MDFIDQVVNSMDGDSTAVLDFDSDAFDVPFRLPDPDDDGVESCAPPTKTDELVDKAEHWLETLLDEGDVAITTLSVAQTHHHPHESHPQPPGLTAPLQDRSSVLVEYYFKEVCGMMSCYDSRMNPYRTTISNIWARSPSLYYVTQSMAAACLSEVSPGLGAAGRQLRDQASASLSLEISSCTASGEAVHTSSLLALVMLGFSLSWHDAGNVGRPEFDLLARTVLSPTNQAGGEALPLDEMQRKVFFYNSFVYWRMLLSFVSDDQLPTPAYPALQPQPRPSPRSEATSEALTHRETRIPHPQTGLGIQVLEILTQVGALVRRERRRIRSRQHSSRADILAAQAAISTAQDLHEQLRAVDLPREAAVVDSGDETTPVDHLLKVAEAYRCAGLLQLYRNFPDLVSAVNGADELGDGGIEAHDWLQTPVTVVSPLPKGRAPAVQGHDDAIRQTLLTSLALHTLHLLRDIPTSSRSRSIQPLLHVIVCSELALSRPLTRLSGRLLDTLGVSGMSPIPPSTTDILTARRLVLTRLATFETVLAAKPIRQMTRLVKQTWAAMDEGQDEVFWMDVMMDGGLETLMG